MADAATKRVMAAVMKRLGYGNYIELAVHLKIVPRRALNRATQTVPDRDKSRKVDNWIKGNNSPRFHPTMTLLSEAGLLQPEAEAAWKGITLEAAEAAVIAARLRASGELAEGLGDGPE